jgi:hypothetical protein
MAIKIVSNSCLESQAVFDILFTRCLRFSASELRDLMPEVDFPWRNISGFVKFTLFCDAKDYVLR